MDVLPQDKLSTGFGGKKLHAFFCIAKLLPTLPDEVRFVLDDYSSPMDILYKGGSMKQKEFLESLPQNRRRNSTNRLFFSSAENSSC
jgi:hypothetical protein